MRWPDKMDVIALCGLGLLSAGCGLVWLPGALIVPGALIAAWVFVLTTQR